MGRVWAARSVIDDTPVALKTLRVAAGQASVWRSGFRREVQAMAGLRHRGIVQIFDYGEVSAEEASDPEFPEGTLWIAMERASHGNLEAARLPVDWMAAKRTLLEILDALAHAHARGIVHRDLKPENVLISATGEHLRFLLSDFGIAHMADPAVSFRTEDIQSVNAGTPAYMPPEQLQGDWREYGPATDLYSFGCVTWELVSGRPLFEGESLLELAMKHISEPVPELQPSVDVPDGFEAWLQALLAKAPGERYQLAADAASALVRLDGSSAWPPPLELPTFSGAASDGSETAATLREGPDLDSTMAGPTLVFEATHQLSDEDLAEVVSSDRSRASNSPTTTRTGDTGPVPKSWRPTASRRQTSLLGTGAALFGLREIPFVDRDEERDILWDSLQRVSDQRGPQLVVIDGPAGSGKSRVSEWIARRAHELGAARYLSLHHSPIARAENALAYMVEAELRVTNLGPGAAYRRIHEFCERHQPRPEDASRMAAALLDLVRPAARVDGVTPVRLESQAERHEIIRHYLSVLCRERPLIVTIDDAQWAHDALGFLQFVFDIRPEDFPVLFVVCIRGEEIAEDSLEDDRVKWLERRADPARIVLGPLPAQAHRELIDRMLGLTKELGDLVQKLTAGDPFFAGELVGHWVQTDALASAPHGYTLRQKNPVLPPDRRALTVIRLDWLANQSPDADAMEALYVAAALGNEVERTQWQAVCSQLNITIPVELVNRLTVAGIARSERDTWLFRRPQYRDVLEELARNAGGWARIHQACAEVIERAPVVRDHEELANHLIEAGEYDSAVEPLWSAILQRLGESAYHEARALGDEYVRLMDVLEVGKWEKSRVRERIVRAEAFRYSHRLEDARQTLQELESGADFLESDTLADLHRVAAGLALIQGRSQDGFERYERARRLYERIGDDVGLGKVLHGEGYLHIGRGGWRAAREALEECVRVSRRAGNRRELAWAYQAMAELFLRTAPGDAVQPARRALEVFENLGSRSGLALSNRTLADARRYQGRYDEAERHYRDSIEIGRNIRSVHQAFGILGLGFLELERGRFEEAIRHIQSRIEDFEEIIPPLFWPLPYVGLACYHAENGSTRSFDQAFETCETLVDFGILPHPDIFRLAERAGDALARSGEEDRARRCYDFALGFRHFMSDEAIENLEHKRSHLNRDERR